jgi:hypothetical protein
MGLWKLMTIGFATPTIAPLTGLNVGAANTGSSAEAGVACSNPPKMPAVNKAVTYPCLIRYRIVTLPI